MALHHAYVRRLRLGRVAAPVTGLASVSGGWRVRCGAEGVLYAADFVEAAGA